MDRATFEKINRIIMLAAAFGLGANSLAQAAGEAPQSFTLDGTLYDSPSGSNVLLDATARVRVQILPPSGSCVIYDEEQVVNTTGSNGAFSIQVGSPTGSPRRYAGSDSNNSMTQIFQNQTDIDGNNHSCTVTASAGSTRRVRVTITPTSGAPDTLTPDMVMASVPNALVAETLQGIYPTGFLKLGFESLSQSNVENIFSTANYSALTTLLAGGGSSSGGSSSGGYAINAGTGGSGGIDFNVNGSTKASITNSGNFSVDSGTFFVDATSNRIGVGTSTPGASLDLGTRTDAIILPNGTTGQRPSPASAGMMRYNSTLQKFEIYDGLAWANIGSDISGITASGDLSGTYPSPMVSKIRGQTVSALATTTGQVLRYDGTNYTPRYVGLSDLKNTAGGNAFSATCSSSQTLTWSSIDDTFLCVNIAGLNASVITAGTIDAARLPPSASAWADATGGINYAGGKVGIGSTAPATTLDIAGSLRATGTWTGPSGMTVSTFNAGGPGTWIDMPTTGPSGIGSGGAGNNAWIAYAKDAEQWLNGSLAGDIVYRNSSGRLLFAPSGTGGGPSMALTGKNVGIGTITPNSPLHVYQNSNNDLVAQIQNAYSGKAAYMQLRANSQYAAVDIAGLSKDWKFGLFGTDQFAVVDGDSGAAPFQVEPSVPTNSLYLKAGGKVGIGTSQPAVALDVSSATDGLAIPRGDVAARPTTRPSGTIRWNTDTPGLELWNGSAWVALTTGASSSYLSSSGGTLSGALTISAGGASVTGGVNNNSGGITNAGSITGVGTNLTGSGALTVAAGGTASDLNLKSSTTGSVNLATGNGTGLSVVDTGVATTNFVTIKGAATAASPVIGTAGAGTNINLSISPKGTGSTIIANGNLGIGVVPSEKLQVAGNVQADNAIVGGSVAWPGFGVRVDGDGSANTLSFVTSNVPAVRVTPTGTVGIGTTTTAAKLDVLAPASMDMARFSGPSGEAVFDQYGSLKMNSGISLQNYDSNVSAGALSTYNSALFLTTDGGGGGTNHNIILKPNGTGKVGVGTTTPNHKLDVNGNLGLAASSYLNFGATDGSTGYGIRDNGGALEYKNSAGSWTTLSSVSSQWTTNVSDIYFTGGKVGIGTATATNTLEVNGSVGIGGLALSNFSGVLAMPSQLLIGGSNVGGLNPSGSSLLRLSSASTSVKFGVINGGPADAFRLGDYDAASPVAQGIHVQNVAGGTSNTAGADFTMMGSRGTGTGQGGKILFQTAPAGSTGSTQNALTTAMTILGSGKVGIANGTPLHTLDVAGNLGLSAASYLNFGTADGATGYGVRDNAGTIEVKNSGGTWAAPGGGVSSQWSTVTGGIAYPTGSVAIGSSTPARTTLQVVGSYEVASASSGAKSYRFRTGGGSLDFDTSGADMLFNAYPSVDYGGTQFSYLKMAAGGGRMDAQGNWVFSTGADYTFGGSTVMAINSRTTGNVGIGTASPGAKLEVASGTANTSGLKLTSLTSSAPTSPGQPIGVDASGNVVTVAAGTGSQWVTATGGINYTGGNVGIGSASPGTALDVNGGIRAGSSAVVTATCNAASEGIQRYNYTNHFLEFCDGTSWFQIPKQGPGSTNNLVATGPASASVYSVSAVTCNYTPTFGACTNLNSGLWIANGSNPANNSSCVQIPANSTAAVIYDLGSVKSIGKIYLTQEDSLPYVTGSISFSTDNITFTSSVSIPGTTYGTSSKFFSVTPSPTASARYVRIMNGSGTVDSANNSFCSLAVGP